MRVLWLALLLTACASRHAVRAEALLREGRPDAAVRVWNERLAEVPGDQQALEGRRTALTAQAELVHRRLTGAGDDPSTLPARLGALFEVDGLVHEGARPPATLEASRATLASAARALVDAPLGVGEALEAEARLTGLAPELELAGFAALAAELKQQVMRVGARRCAVLTDSTRTPWLGAAVARYCEHYKLKGPDVRGFPERRGALELTATHGTLAGATLTGPLGEAVRRAFAASPWHDAGSAGTTTASLTGALESEVEQTPMELTTSWTESEAYSTTEQQTENYQESYMTSEQRSVQVPYTAYESYSYSCGTGSSYRTCTGSRSVTRYRTEYRTEMVTKTRPATRQVTKTVTKYRPVTRSLRYPGIQHRVVHAAKLKVSLALPTFDRAVELGWADTLSKTDVEHSTTSGPARLSPHLPEVPLAADWTRLAAAALEREVTAGLGEAWLRQFCGDVSTPELAARCLASSRAPEAPWEILARYFGEDPRRLRAALRGP